MEPPNNPTTLNKNDRKAVKRAVQWLREYVNDADLNFDQPAIQANEIVNALEQVLDRDKRTRDNAKVEAARYSVKEDVTGDWVGYCRNTKVKQFGANKVEADAWLADMTAEAQPRMPDTLEADWINK